MKWIDLFIIKISVRVTNEVMLKGLLILVKMDTAQLNEDVRWSYRA